MIHNKSDVAGAIVLLCVLILQWKWNQSHRKIKTGVPLCRTSQQHKCRCSRN